MVALHNNLSSMQEIAELNLVVPRVIRSVTRIPVVAVKFFLSKRQN